MRSLPWARIAMVVGWVLIALWPGSRAGGVDLAAEFRSARDSIRGDAVLRHIEVLADDTFEGREAGKRGGRAAAGYLVEEFRKRGLAPAGTRGYFQEFGAGYRNLLGAIEGSDPRLKDEWILIGAHYDHVGYGNAQNSYGPVGYIHNGADDNASGTAGLLELVGAFQQLGTPPRRSLLLVLWDGEEKGLLGSKHWLVQPTLPVEQIRLMANMDMIGRLSRNRIEAYGSRTLPGLRGLVSRHNRDTRLTIDYTWEMADNSDHFPFYERSVPVLMLHTGLHDDYHRPSDDVERIDARGMQRVLRVLFGVIYELAQADTIGGFRAAARSEAARGPPRVASARTVRSRLGVRWAPEQSATGGVLLSGVRPGSAAERAGLRAGDRLLEVAGVPIEGYAHLLALVLAAESPVELLIERPLAEQPLRLSVELDGAPVRVGIVWRVDAAEPEAVVVTEVFAGSAADQAGIRPGDLIYEVSGQRFESSDQFRALLEGSGPWELLVERAGILEPRLVAPPLIPMAARGQ